MPTTFQSYPQLFCYICRCEDIDSASAVNLRSFFWTIYRFSGGLCMLCFVFPLLMLTFFFQSHFCFTNSHKEQLPASLVLIHPPFLIYSHFQNSLVPQCVQKHKYSITSYCFHFKGILGSFIWNKTSLWSLKAKKVTSTLWPMTKSSTCAPSLPVIRAGRVKRKWSFANWLLPYREAACTVCHLTQGKIFYVHH